jgi:hypothetical protein
MILRHTLITFILLLFFASSFAQQAPVDSAQIKVDSVSSEWSFSASGYYYNLPTEENTGTFIGYAVYDAWHVEARYNYEGEKTASVFSGYRFETGDKIVFGITPMAGAVFGNTNGIAPGLELDMAWKKFDFYSESEYVFDFESKENNFLYTWTELAISPFVNFRTGLSANRTRLFQTDLDFARGVFAQYSFSKLTGGVHYFNPFSNGYFVLATLGIEL